MVPVLEFPTGELISESSVVAYFATDRNPNKGIALIPKDPLVAAQMRLRME